MTRLLFLSSDALAGVGTLWDAPRRCRADFNDALKEPTRALRVS
jgi:hypothetical protein